MNLVDTPGTNVILQRQQRLTEEYVPRADLILFVLSSDRPLTESEVRNISFSNILTYFKFLVLYHMRMKFLSFLLEKTEICKQAAIPTDPNNISKN
jgi:hypothetical protein